MIRGVFVLLACQLLGEALARAFALPAPGPVIGLALLVAALAAYARFRPFDDAALEKSDVATVSSGLLRNLSLLFVPAGVGVVQYAGLVERNALALAAALVVSTALTLLASVGAFLAVKRALAR